MSNYYWNMGLRYHANKNIYNALTKYSQYLHFYTQFINTTQDNTLEYVKSNWILDLIDKFLPLHLFTTLSLFFNWFTIDPIQLVNFTIVDCIIIEKKIEEKGIYAPKKNTIHNIFIAFVQKFSSFSIHCSCFYTGF